MGYSPWGHKESDTIEQQLTLALSYLHQKQILTECPVFVLVISGNPG